MVRTRMVNFSLRRFLTGSFTTATLGVGCVAALLWIYGSGSPGAGARLEAASLASTEISEMVGTNSYVKSDRSGVHEPLTALMQTFGIPLGYPAGMIESEYPTAVQPAPSTGSTETSLMTPITQWAEASPKQIAMGWIPSGASTSQSIKLIADNTGMNVVSPTWFTLWSGDGTVQDYVQPGVLAYAHQHHIQVWAMVDNQYSSTLAHAMLASAQARGRFIDTLVRAATKDHLDGLNLDFENMHTSDQVAYTAMVGQLHRELAKRHIKLSVDITPDIIFLRDTDVYFHAGLSANADYVIVMAYDEHWRTDSVPGPVADIPWVTTAVNDLLNTGVPADKLVLGVPFYTYFWHVATDGSVSAEAIAMSEVQSILSNHHATGSYDEGLHLGYAKYPKPDGYEEVWYETPRTLRDQLGLVQDLGLAGVAVWSLQLSDPHSWSLLMQALRNSLS